MTVGADVKKALSEVGVSFTIKRDSGNFSGEKLIYDIPSGRGIGNQGAFARDSLLEGSLAYDTLAIEGDVLELSNGKRVLVASKTPDMFQDATVVYEATFLKCNVTSGELYRSSGEVWSDDYHKKQIWELVKTGINSVLVEVSGTQLSDRDELGLLSLKRTEMYIASGENLKIHDRFQSKSGEFYRVDVIEKSIYPAIYVIKLSEDTR